MCLQRPFLRSANKLIGFLFFFNFIPQLQFAQELPNVDVQQEPKASPVPNKYRDYKINIKANAGIPTPTFNPAFQKVFTGTIDVNVQSNYNIFRGFCVGLASKYLLLKIIPSKLALISTEYHLANGSFVLGYDHQFSNNSILSFSVLGGKNWMKYRKIEPPENQTTFYAIDKYQAYNFETMIGYYFYAEENFAIGGNFGYNTIYSTFNPNNIYVDKYKEFSSRDYKGYTQYLSISFGVYYGI